MQSEPRSNVSPLPVQDSTHRLAAVVTGSKEVRRKGGKEEGCVPPVEAWAHCLWMEIGFIKSSMANSHRPHPSPMAKGTCLHQCTGALRGYKLQKGLYCGLETGQVFNFAKDGEYRSFIFPVLPAIMHPSSSTIVFFLRESSSPAFVNASSNEKVLILRSINRNQLVHICSIVRCSDVLTR